MGKKQQLTWSKLYRLMFYCFTLSLFTASTASFPVWSPTWCGLETELDRRGSWSKGVGAARPKSVQAENLGVAILQFSGAK